MALLSVIRRRHFRDQLSIREIARRSGLPRNTIRKYLRSGAIEPRLNMPDRPSKLDPFAERPSAWLRREMSGTRKQKRTMKQLHADLVSLGYEGSYICCRPMKCCSTSIITRSACWRHAALGIYDNMRTAVGKVGRGKERNVNTRFQTMVSHYLFEAEFCNPAAGWEKDAGLAADALLAIPGGIS